MKPEDISREVQVRLDALVRSLSREDYSETLGLLIADLEMRQEAVTQEMEDDGE